MRGIKAVPVPSFHFIVIIVNTEECDFPAHLLGVDI